MLRLNIYRIHLPIPLESFIQKLVKSQSVSNTEYGIRNKDYDLDEYSGIFFQRIIVNARNFNGNGEEQHIHYEYFQDFDFEILTKENNVYLIVYDAPKSLKKFLNVISDLAGVGFYFFDDSLNLENISYNSMGFLDFKVIKAKISNISILNKAVASMEIQSVNNAVKDFDQYSNDKNRKITKIKIRYYINGILNTLEISNKGNFVIHTDSFSRKELNLILENFYKIS
ncbi:TPA: hypothetical protein VAM19_001236 [Acinetobacter baumannii]|nr:hypothetical protein [Acinetobacter baumannii]HEN9517550.1 hypothetical protein [Acinetobacter baumannii]HEO1800162.1 hypothetical protein [Acinetobacter baumannii]